TATAKNLEVTKDDVIKQHVHSPSLGGYGWNRPGIDYRVGLDGRLDTIIPEESPGVVDLWGISEGARPLHGTAIYLASLGGKNADGSGDADTRTPAQKETLAAVVQFYVRRFPKIQVLGFNSVPSKSGEAMPSFDVVQWCGELKIPASNIFNPQ